MVPRELQNCNYLDSIALPVPKHDMATCGNGAYHPSQQSDSFAKSNTHDPKDFFDRKCTRSQNSLEQIRRTVFVNGLGHDITEEILTTTFLPCGEIADCRVCASPSSSMRNGYLEFKTEISARSALSYSGIYLGKNTIRVVPSKTAIIPIDERFLPRSNEERARVARTIYVSNIDNVIYSDFLRCFFESRCGPVNKIRLLSDSKNRQTKIAFIEFSMEISAQTALKCSGIMLGNLSIRVSPSKTPLHASGDSGKHKSVPSTKNQFLNSSSAIAGQQSVLCSDQDLNLKYWMTLQLLRSELNRIIADSNQGISTPLSGALNTTIDTPSVLSRQMSSESDIRLEYRSMFNISDASPCLAQTHTFLFD